MGRPASTFLFAVAIVAGGAGAAAGQVGYTACSLEWLVADADVVVCGTVVDVVREPAREDAWAWEVVTLDVRGVLKGDKADRLTFVVHALKTDDTLRKWKEARPDQLWFLQRPAADDGRAEPPDARREAVRVMGLYKTDLQSPGLGWGVCRLGPKAAGDPDRPPPPYLTMDLRLLKTSEDILKAVRETAAKGGSRRPGRTAWTCRGGSCSRPAGAGTPTGCWSPSTPGWRLSPAG